MDAFLGLTADAFAVYTPERWSSYVHNLPRMRNKAALMALTAAIEGRLGTLLAGLSRAASDEVPSISNHKRVEAQWVYWCRDAAARTALASFLEKTPLDGGTIFNIAPQDKHVSLAVVARASGLWVGLRVAPGAVVDRRNLAQKLSLSWERAHFLGLLQALPAGAEAGAEGATRPLAEVDDAAAGALGQALAGADASWQVGAALPVSACVELGPGLVEALSTWVEALSPLYRFVAWTRDNDLIEAGRQLAEEKAQKRRQASAYRAGDRVRVTAGLFRGKVGEVVGVDAKGQVRLRVDKLAVVVAGENLLIL